MPIEGITWAIGLRREAEEKERRTGVRDREPSLRATLVLSAVTVVGFFLMMRLMGIEP